MKDEQKAARQDKPLRERLNQAAEDWVERNQVTSRQAVKDRAAIREMRGEQREARHAEYGTVLGDLKRNVIEPIVQHGGIPIRFRTRVGPASGVVGAERTSVQFQPTGGAPSTELSIDYEPMDGGVGLDFGWEVQFSNTSEPSRHHPVDIDVTVGSTTDGTVGYHFDDGFVADAPGQIAVSLKIRYAY